MAIEEDRHSLLSVEKDGVRSTSRLGNIARGAVALALHSMGKCVLLPLNDDQRYDLVIDEGEGFLRVQCKLGRLIKGCVEFRTCSYNPYAKGRLYTAGEIDLFGVYCGELHTCYLVPVDEVPAQRCYLRVEPSRNNRAQRVRWAKDYLIGEVRCGARYP